MVNQKPDIDVAMGPLTRNKFKKLLDECDIKQQVADKFNNGVRGFYGCAYNHCVKWLKLDWYEMSYSNIEQTISFFSNVN